MTQTADYIGGLALGVRATEPEARREGFTTRLLEALCGTVDPDTVANSRRELTDAGAEIRP